LLALPQCLFRRVLAHILKRFHGPASYAKAAAGQGLREEKIMGSAVSLTTIPDSVVLA
jgi:hypothetical protein